MGTEETFAAEVEPSAGVPVKDKTVLICALLFVLVLWTFLPSLRNDFVNCDDDVYVTANHQVRSGLTWEGVQWAFRTTAAANWHPLTWLSHMLDCQLFGLKSCGHHLSSVLLHAANTLLLFLVLRRMTGATWRSFFVAAVFGLHPLRVESVAWVAERKDVLSVFFALLTLMAYVRYADKVQSPSSRANPSLHFGPWALDYILALGCFTLGLMSKPMLVTLPFVLLLLDSWPLDRWTNKTAWSLVAEKGPFLVLAAASCVVTFVAQKRADAMVVMAGTPLAARLENALVAYCRYLGKFFWPENLSVIYPVVDSWPFQAVAGSILLLSGLSACAIALRRRCPWWVTGWFWFLGALVPVIGLVAVGEQSIANRYTYLPSIGILILLAWTAHDLTRRWRHQVVTASLAVAGVILVCIALTRHNAGYWRDSETLFRHAVQTTRNNYGAHSNLGHALLGQGRLDDALDQFQEAVRLRPGAAATHNNLGIALDMKGRSDQAINQFQTALRLMPNYAHARFNLGKALEEQGRLDEAAAEYQAALSLEPDNLAALNSLGIVLASQGRLDEAVSQFQKAIQRHPDDSSAHNNLGIVLNRKGFLDAATAQFREAIRLDPGNYSAQQNLEAILKTKRD